MSRAIWFMFSPSPTAHLFPTWTSGTASAALGHSLQHYGGTELDITIFYSSIHTHTTQLHTIQISAFKSLGPNFFSHEQNMFQLALTESLKNRKHPCNSQVNTRVQNHPAPPSPNYPKFTPNNPDRVSWGEPTPRRKILDMHAMRAPQSCIY